MSKSTLIIEFPKTNGMSNYLLRRAIKATLKTVIKNAKITLRTKVFIDRNFGLIFIILNSSRRVFLLDLLCDVLLF